MTSHINNTMSTSIITICPMAPHYCDEALNGGKCPHEMCDIPHCPKHTSEHHAIILKQKGLTKCEECGGIEGKDCDCDDDAEECPRCKEYHCEEDDDHDERSLWLSHVDNVYVCRGCISAEKDENGEVEGVDYVMVDGEKEPVSTAVCYHCFDHTTKKYYCKDEEHLCMSYAWCKCRYCCRPCECGECSVVGGSCK